MATLLSAAQRPHAETTIFSGAAALVVAVLVDLVAAQAVAVVGAVQVVVVTLAAAAHQEVGNETI